MTATTLLLAAYVVALVGWFSTFLLWRITERQLAETKRRLRYRHLDIVASALESYHRHRKEPE